MTAANLIEAANKVVTEVNGSTLSTAGRLAWEGLTPGQFEDGDWIANDFFSLFGSLDSEKIETVRFFRWHEGGRKGESGSICRTIADIESAKAEMVSR
jgi:hypothetical protein